MAINAWIDRTEPGRGSEASDLILHCLDDNTDKPLTLRLMHATIIPHQGDFVHAGCAGVRQPDGTVFGGQAFIASNEHPTIYYPLRRVSHACFIQDWDAEPVRGEIVAAEEG